MVVGEFGGRHCASSWMSFAIGIFVVPTTARILGLRERAHSEISNPAA